MDPSQLLQILCVEIGQEIVEVADRSVALVVLGWPAARDSRGDGPFQCPGQLQDTSRREFLTVTHGPSITHGAGALRIEIDCRDDQGAEVVALARLVRTDHRHVVGNVDLGVLAAGLLRVPSEELQRERFDIRTSPLDDELSTAIARRDDPTALPGPARMGNLPEAEARLGDGSFQLPCTRLVDLKDAGFLGHRSPSSSWSLVFRVANSPPREFLRQSSESISYTLPFVPFREAPLPPARSLNSPHDSNQPRVTRVPDCVPSIHSLLLTVLVVMATTTAYAQGPGWRKVVEGGVTVQFPQGSANDPVVRELVKEYPGLLRNVAEALSLDAPASVEVFVCPDLPTVERHTLEPVPAWSAALAQPLKRRLFLRMDRIPQGDRRALHDILKHESAHLVMGGLPKHVFEKLPLWFHEGVAQKYAGHLFAFSWDELAMRVRPMESPALDKLIDKFPRTEYEAQTAYLYSEAIVGLMMRLWGSDVIPRILDELGRRSSFNAAVLSVTGRPVIWHERRLHEELASDRTVLVRYLYGFFGGLCFLAMVPFLAMGVYRARRRRNALHAHWDLEEQRQEEDEDDDLGQDDWVSR